MIKLIAGAFIALCLVICSAVAMSAEPPAAALHYKRTVMREAKAVLALNAPVAVIAAQIHQESHWKPAARSAYADGLAQFTPDTARWISGVYSKDLGPADPFNPNWAIRALLRYDRHLYERMPASADCDRWAFTLAAYNGGPGWISKDQALARRAGANPNLWFGNVENYSGRARWAFKENRAYPRLILLKHQPLYAAWGGTVECNNVKNP